MPHTQINSQTLDTQTTECLLQTWDVIAFLIPIINITCKQRIINKTCIQLCERSKGQRQ
ncbi:hypothetical protein DPMN_171928 [Dreissena polymorpha]|uniref:Uncharacterized protein n=1 Tax=Dreissena polymorpha TaxID=45954 RepID=A0A9D4E198_DREPO|nr:hypothetical protein DPMN_171928 [Dreissena polymorpha]